MNKKLENEFVTHEQASAYLGLSKATLYNKISKGKIKVYKVAGSHINRFKISDLDALFQLKR